MFPLSSLPTVRFACPLLPRYTAPSGSLRRLSAGIDSFTELAITSPARRLPLALSVLADSVCIFSTVVLFLLLAQPAKHRTVIMMAATVGSVNGLAQSRHFALVGLQVFSCCIQFFF